MCIVAFYVHILKLNAGEASKNVFFELSGLNWCPLTRIWAILSFRLIKLEVHLYFVFEALKYLKLVFSLRISQMNIDLTLQFYHAKTTFDKISTM